MPELDHITIRGFRSIASIDELKLGDINVLIGPNGSGKSNFIGVFAFLHAIREGQLQDYVAKAGGANRLLHFGVRNTKQAGSCDVSFRDGDEPVRHPIGANQPRWTYPNYGERCSIWDKKNY